MASTSGKLERYRQLLVSLLPKGRLWQPKDQPVFNDLLESAAQELCRVDDRRQQLLLEIDPRTTDEALDQWETFLGIPDECTPDGQTDDERRLQIVQKLTNIGGLSKTFYEFIGAQLGFPTVVVENRINFLAGRARAGDLLTNYFNRHFVAGSLAGTRLAEPGWRFYFNVELPITASSHFVAGSLAGTPLQSFSNELLECTFRKLKPANAGVTFTFK